MRLLLVALRYANTKTYLDESLEALEISVAFEDADGGGRRLVFVAIVDDGATGSQNTASEQNVEQRLPVTPDRGRDEAIIIQDGHWSKWSMM